MNEIKRGFTIVELMVVVIIVGIIAAFALPNYRNATAKADERNAVLMARQFQAIQKIHKEINGEYINHLSPDYNKITDMVSSYHNLYPKIGISSMLSNNTYTFQFVSCENAYNIRIEVSLDNEPCCRSSADFTCKTLPDCAYPQTIVSLCP